MSAGSTLRSLARLVLGPPLRRLRRELQWHAPGVDFSVVRGSTEGYPYEIAAHSTPLFRELAGVDPLLQRNKVQNLRIAASALDGIVLEPGVRLSFWREVGRPSRRRGFLEGLVLDHGQLKAGVGGGLCQLTNLLYWMTLHTPLQVVERWRHSYDVFPDSSRTQPFGSGATCAWPALDLQIENRTQSAFRLSMRVTETQLEGAWHSTSSVAERYRIEERAHRMSHEAPGVYVRHNELWRVVTESEGPARGEELIAANHALMMYEPFLQAASHERIDT